MKENLISAVKEEKWKPEGYLYHDLGELNLCQLKNKRKKPPILGPNSDHWFQQLLKITKNLVPRISSSALQNWGIPSVNILSNQGRIFLYLNFLISQEGYVI